MQYSESVYAMWAAYLHSLGEEMDSTEKTFTAWSFCDNEPDARELADLVKAGRKRATASAYWTFEAGVEPMPAVGDYSVIIDWAGEAQCIIQTTGIEIVPFNEVTAEFAAREGEGDSSLEYWRRAHRSYFPRALQEIGRQFEETMPVVCETFEVVY